jgi:hypothetical protein
MLSWLTISGHSMNKGSAEIIMQQKGGGVQNVPQQVGGCAWFVCAVPPALVTATQE